MNNRTSFRHKVLSACAVMLLSVAPFASADIDQARLEAVSAATKAAVDEGKLAGIVTLVAQDGEVELFEAHGYQDLENRKPMNKDSIFRIFSMTKPVTGTALMMLWDEGKFKLDDPVAKYIPEFKDLQVASGVDDEGKFKTVPADHPMTVRELMSHTGGLVYTPLLSRGPVAEAYGKAGVLDRNMTLKEMTKKLGGIPLNHQPGTQWVYSVSVDVQSYLVEVLSGQTFDVFLQERLFKPLGMKDTAFHVTEDKADRLSRAYAPDEGGRLVSEPNGPFLEKPALFSGGGGLTSTAGDYLRFAQMHLNKGELDGVRILSEQAAELMRQNHLPEGVENIGPFYPGNVFGLDFAVVTDSAANNGVPEGSFWWWGIAGTWFWIDPVEDIVFIGMIQNQDLMYARQLQAQVKSLMYQPL
ncbi:serine hydrolase domain-containing protein [Gilvimarinus sp. F26214L]|uniref:serine hydrolase domain-containing protein n=1 Tax=Gilvimarinus sp. DZF01 TaxID=3461371 RepID=UPI004045C938